MSRGYSTSYKPSYYQGGRYNGNRDSYLTSIQEGRPSSGTGGHGSRGTTPIERSGVEAPSVGLSMLAAAINGSNNRKAVRESKSYGITSSYTPAAYKYFSRSDNFYNPTILFNRSMASDNTSSLTKRESLKTVNTEELDVDTNKERDTKRDHAIPGQIVRDTADTRIAGGRQVIRMVTTKQKTNPYNVVGSRNKISGTGEGENNIEPEELTMGQKLAMKHYLRDPEKKKANQEMDKDARDRELFNIRASRKMEMEKLGIKIDDVKLTKSEKIAAAAAVNAGSESEEWSSDWTWETCSSSDEEGVDFVRKKDGSYSCTLPSKKKNDKSKTKPSNESSKTSTLSSIPNRALPPSSTLLSRKQTANDDTLSIASSSNATSVTDTSGTGTDVCSTKTFENEPTFHSSLRELSGSIQVGLDSKSSTLTKNKNSSKPSADEYLPYQSILSKYSSKYANHSMEGQANSTDVKDSISSKAESNDTKNANSTSVTTPSTVKKPNYDWLRPPKPQIINTIAQKQSEEVESTYKDPRSVLSKSVVVNKALSTVSSSSSDSSSSPANRKIGLRAYTGAGSNTVQTFPSDEESDDGNQVDFVSAWRPGQPPRSDCIIKLTKGKDAKKNEAKKVSVDNTKQCKNVTPNNIYNSQTTPKPLTSEVPAISNLSQVSSSHAEAVNKAANKILVGSSVSLATTTTSIEKDVKSSLEHKAIPKDEPKIPEEPKPVTEYSDQLDELVSKCTLSCIVFEGHEKPIQMEMYERPSEVKITSNLVLRPESYKDLLKGSTVLQPMIVENVSPLVVHLVDVGSVSTATESNVKFNFDEKTQPIANATHGIPTTTFEKTVNTSIESLERPNRFAEIEEPQSKKLDIKTYHPPPEPPSIPSIVRPPTPKRRDQVPSVAHIDPPKHDVRRSFASSDDFEERDGKSHVISISDGESENYYAGTSEDDSLDEDVFNVSTDSSPHTVGSSNALAVSNAVTKIDSSSRQDEQKEKEIPAISFKHDNEAKVKSVDVSINKSKDASMVSSELTTKAYSTVKPVVNNVKEKEAAVVSKVQKESKSNVIEKVDKKENIVKQEEKNQRNIVAKPNSQLVDKTKEISSEKAIVKDDIASAQKTDQNSVHVNSKAVDKNVRSKVIESVTKKDDTNVSANQKKDAKTTLTLPADTSLNITEKSKSARGSEGETQTKRFRTDSSSSYGSLFGGSSSIEHDASTIAAQLEKIPSPVRKMFESKSKMILCGEDGFPSSENLKADDQPKPKYWNNVPKSNSNNVNPLQEMHLMRQEQKAHQAKLKAEQAAMIDKTEEAEDPWYKEESDYMQEQLQQRLHEMPEDRRPSDKFRDPNQKCTPEENMAIIRLYGGIQFPDTPLEFTPSYLLRKFPSSLSETEEEDSSSESDASNPFNNGRRINTSTNFPPVVERPPFRKYGVNDFRYLKVLGKGSFGKVILAELRKDENDIQQTGGDKRNNNTLSHGRGYYAIKCLKKDLVLEDDDVECTMIERKVLTLGCKHPFLCPLFCSYQTDSHLFFVMEYLNGGDLMFHIQQVGRFDVERARFYAAEILLALRFLHKKGIVYRDLKLDNLLLDHEGHIRIADFGMCKLQAYLDTTTDTFCGTPDYMAPEIIKGLKYTFSVDWWSFGVLLYEMLIGQSPFNGCDEDELFWSICNEQAFFPKFLVPEAVQILTRLLEKDPSKRLGIKGYKHGDVSEQSFFRNVNFEQLEKKQVIPPFKPKVRHPMDVSNFDSAFTQDDALLTPVDPEFLETVEQQQFKGFSFTNPNYTLPQ